MLLLLQANTSKLLCPHSHQNCTRSSKQGCCCDTHILEYKVGIEDFVLVERLLDYHLIVRCIIDTVCDAVKSLKQQVCSQLRHAFIFKFAARSANIVTRQCQTVPFLCRRTKRQLSTRRLHLAGLVRCWRTARSEPSCRSVSTRRRGCRS